MSGDFKRITAQSTMHIPYWQSGHTDHHSMPCTAYAIYNATTGTLILEEVWCSGRSYGPSELIPEEYEKYMALLVEQVAEQYA